MKTIKVTHALVAAGLSLSLLAGCGGGGSDKPAEKTGTAATADDSSTAVPAGYYTSPDGKWAANFLSAPKTQAQPTPVGGITINLEVTSVVTGTENQVVGTADFAEGLKAANSTMEKELEGVIKGTQQVSQAEEVSNEETKVQGLPARRFELKLPEGGAATTAIGVVVADGTVMYQVMAVGSDKASLTKFVDSFKILKKSSNG